MTTVCRSRIANSIFLADVITGLSQPQKRLPSKYFYDVSGSRLFDRITALPEYYPTRTELGILRDHADAIAQLCGPGCLLIELGAGSSTKIRLLLEQLEQLAGYVPVDISGDYLCDRAQELARDYPHLPVRTVVADFTAPFELPDVCANRRVVFFPGSTIGNFTPPETEQLLTCILRLVGQDGGLLIGVDLQKDRNVLESAYNDAAGVTAEFNRNLLTRINRELDADFDLTAFRHHAFYNESLSRIEMHLISLSEQRVRVGDRQFRLRKGESIHTENSYKYEIREFSEQMGSYGFRMNEVWTDAARYFAVLYLTASSLPDDSR